MGYYTNEFLKLGKISKSNHAKELLEAARNKGMRVVLATNPVFPEVAVEARLNWIGLSIKDFDHVSHAENSKICKPNPEYFKQLLELIGAEAQNTLMVGNDFFFDMAARNVGIKTWMIDKNQSGERVNVDYEGSIPQLIEFLRA